MRDLLLRATLDVRKLGASHSGSPLMDPIYKYSKFTELYEDAPLFSPTTHTLYNTTEMYIDPCDPITLDAYSLYTLTYNPWVSGLLHADDVYFTIELLFSPAPDYYERIWDQISSGAVYHRTHYYVFTGANPVQAQLSWGTPTHALAYNITVNGSGLVFWQYGTKVLSLI